MLEGMILKPNMVLPGLTCPKQESVDEVADATVTTLLRTVPVAVPGVAFLSGGQPGELASARLNSMNVRFRSQLPWALTFSFSRAIQQPALEIWRGQDTNVKASQQALLIAPDATAPRAGANTMQLWNRQEHDNIAVVWPANGRADYAGSQGVCLRHLGLCLPFLADDEIVRLC